MGIRAAVALNLLNLEAKPKPCRASSKAAESLHSSAAFAGFLTVPDRDRFGRL